MNEMVSKGYHNIFEGMISKIDTIPFMVGWVGGAATLMFTGPHQILSSVAGALIISVFLSFCSGIGSWMAREAKVLLSKRWKNRKK